ncbi:MAG: ExeM/NucH family extracellular endonuclease [Bacteroidales bacterium]
MKYLFFIILTILSVELTAQTSLNIPQIQGTSSISPYNTQKVKTSGIVTAKFIGTGKINGFFLQDPTGDGNTLTSDGIFVATTTDNIAIGDKIEVTGTVSEVGTRTQIGTLTAQTKISGGNPLPITKVKYNADNWNWEIYEGMLLEFDQTLFVTSNYNLKQYGQLSLNPTRVYTPTNQVLPGSADYTLMVQNNNKAQITLDDAISTTNYAPIQFADANGTRRTGERVTNFRTVVDYVSQYVIYAAETPKFYGNPRPTAPTELGDYNAKVCAANLENFLVESFDPTYGGPKDATESARQLGKISAAMVAIDADVYGLIEVQQGQTALTALANAMNNATVAGRYSYIDDGTKVNTTYNKVAYLYRTDKVAPYLALKNNNVSPTNRKKLQAFTLKSNNEKFIFGINHFKAKSGCSSASGSDADMGDGQSCYNYTRVQEASSVITQVNTNKTYYGDEDVLIMGDLNAYGKEDPIQTLVKAGYTDLHRSFHADSAYSYVYNDEAGYLDNALASPSLLPQITGITVFHVNADEPTMFGYAATNYQPDMYRYSDHDPVVVGLALGKSAIPQPQAKDSLKISPTLVADHFTVSNANSEEMSLLSINGKAIKTYLIHSNSQRIEIGNLNLPSGVYLVRFSESGTIRRLIIRK